MRKNSTNTSKLHEACARNKRTDQKQDMTETKNRQQYRKHWKQRARTRQKQDRTEANKQTTGQETKETEGENRTETSHRDRTGQEQSNKKAR
jgi:hypothetical protein